MEARPPEPRQRWRLVVAREAAAREMLHRDVAAAWEAGLLGSGLAVSMSEAATPRPRIAFAAPAPVGVLGERELIDVALTQLSLLHDVRAAVTAATPAGYRLVDLYDVWLSSPTLAALVVAGDYRTTLDDPPATADVQAGTTALLAADRIVVVRTKGHGQVTVDIRPHVRDVRVAADAGESGPLGLWMRLRLGGEGGIGRPEEVVAALGERLGRRLVTTTTVRERIVLADDADA